MWGFNSIKKFNYKCSVGGKHGLAFYSSVLGIINLQRLFLIKKVGGKGLINTIGMFCPVLSESQGAA